MKVGMIVSCRSRLRGYDLCSLRTFLDVFDALLSCRHCPSLSRAKGTHPVFRNSRLKAPFAMRISRLALSFGLLCPALAATVTYNFTIEWVTANPDGAFNRPTIGINGQWPIPRIDANVGDRVIVHAHNELGNQSTSLHFHGLFMNNATHMDGPSMVTQCAILPGSSMTYNFTVS